MVFTGGSSGRFFFFFGGGAKSLKKKVIWNDCFAAMGDDFHLRTTDALSNKFQPVTEYLWLKLHNASFMIPIHNWSTSTPLLYICNWFTPVSYVGYEFWKKKWFKLSCLFIFAAVTSTQHWQPRKLNYLTADSLAKCKLNYVHQHLIRNHCG